MYDVQHLSKTYRKSGETVRALDDLDFKLAPCEFLVLHGASGSGKTTLLLILGGMLTPSSGAVHCNGVDLYSSSRTDRSRFRRSAVGFIFQQFHLMPYLTAYDNIRVALALRSGHAHGDIHALAERLGIADRLSHRPGELSVGEQQRVAMARTLICEPDIILADEPTGNLDAANRNIIAECLAEEHRRGRTIVLATHEERLLELGTRTLELDRGRIKKSSARP